MIYLHLVNCAFSACDQLTHLHHSDKKLGITTLRVFLGAFLYKAAIFAALLV